MVVNKRSLQYRKTGRHQLQTCGTSASSGDCSGHGGGRGRATRPRGHVQLLIKDRQMYIEIWLPICMPTMQYLQPAAAAVPARADPHTCALPGDVDSAHAELYLALRMLWTTVNACVPARTHACRAALHEALTGAPDGHGP